MIENPYKTLAAVRAQAGRHALPHDASAKETGQCLIRRECCNCEDGNCSVLDDGDTCTCPQMISFSVCCKWFRWAVLPLAGTLEVEIYRDKDLNAVRSVAARSSQNPTGRNTAQTAPPKFTGGRKQKVNGKGGLLWTVKGGKSLDLSGFASPKPGQVV